MPPPAETLLSSAHRLASSALLLAAWAVQTSQCHRAWPVACSWVSELNRQGLGLAGLLCAWFCHLMHQQTMLAR